MLRGTLRRGVEWSELARNGGADLSWQHPGIETGDARAHLAPVFDEINLRRARLLTRLASGRSVRAVADELSMAHETARSEVKRLKSLTGLESVGQLRAWWMLNAASWTAHVAAAADFAQNSA